MLILLFLRLLNFLVIFINFESLVLLYIFLIFFLRILFKSKFIGKERGNVYDRVKFLELVKVIKEFNDFKNDEVNIILGVLDLFKKFVKEVMIKIEDVYMFDINSVLDFEIVFEIMKRGYIRIFIYENDLGNIVVFLNIKDLALIDFDDKIFIRIVIKFY